MACLGSVEERVVSSPGAINLLVGDEQMTGGNRHLEASDGTRTDDPVYPEFLHCPGVGPEGNPMGWKLVFGAVAGKKRHLYALETPNRKLSRRRAVRSLDCYGPWVVEEVVEPRTTEYTNHVFPSCSRKW